jgi:hypothetical protein
MSKTKTNTSGKSSTLKSKELPQMEFAFGKINYILMVVGIVFIFLGYVLMSGGGSSDPTVFNPAIFDTQRLTIAPFVVLVGYGIEVLAIVIKAKD